MEERERFSSFRPRAYLDEYYASVGPENDALLSFYATFYKNHPKGGLLLEVGGGPTLYSLISASPIVDEIHFSDALPTNLAEVRQALNNEPGAFDWRPFIERALTHEGRPSNHQAIATRQAAMKEKVKRFLPLDIFEATLSKSYNIIQANFVLDSITSDPNEWRSLLAKLCGSVPQGGEFLMTALEGSRWWKIGSLQFPAVSLDREILGTALSEAGLTGIHIERIRAQTETAAQGYTGILCARARRG